MSERVIIGTSEHFGWPISAPVVKEHGVLTPVRWAERNNSFVLEWWHPGHRVWIEVPFVKMERTK